MSKPNIARIKERIDFARINVYNLFVDARDEADLYLEEILNCFISAVQYPLNFAVYDENNTLLFHFLSDKLHYKKFSKALKKKEYHQYSVPLFENFLGHSKYKILTLYMHNKEERDRYNKLCAPINTGNLKDTIPEHDIENLTQYLSYCTSRFFEEKWIGFGSQFSLNGRKALENSISTLSSKARLSNKDAGDFGWPPDNKILHKNLKTTPLPQNAEEWHSNLQILYTPMLRDSKYGLKNQMSFMLNEAASQIELTETNSSKMLIAYRTFSRTDARVEDTNENSGYLYNSRFLIPSSDSLESFFNLMSNDYAKIKSGKKKYRDQFGELYFDLAKGLDDQLSSFKYIIRKADRIFWSMLSKHNGVEKCIDILQSNVGENVRSLVDPVYYTGLIHTNMLFENGGLDRLANIPNGVDREELERYVHDNQNDILRIVILYYLFSAMARNSTKKLKHHAKNLVAVLIPVKFRGSVWAVTIHPMYIADYEKNYLNDHFWISYHLLTTSIRKKNQLRIDWILWENAQQRIADHLIKHIGNGTPGAFPSTIKKINEDLRSEHRLVPYALPQFSLSPFGEGIPRQAIQISSPSNNKFNIYWKISENPFFQAQQKWNEQGTRTPQQTIKFAIDKGLDRMKSKITSQLPNTTNVEGSE